MRERLFFVVVLSPIKTFSPSVYWGIEGPKHASISSDMAFLSLIMSTSNFDYEESINFQSVHYPVIKPHVILIHNVITVLLYESNDRELI